MFRKTNIKFRVPTEQQCSGTPLVPTTKPDMPGTKPAVSACEFTKISATNGPGLCMDITVEAVG